MNDSEKYPSILPCPFCGKNMNDQFEFDPEDTIYPVTRDHSVWNIVCQKSSGGCDASMLGRTILDCIQKWNTRVSN